MHKKPSNDDGQGGERKVEPKISAEQLVGGGEGPSAAELMNDLQASGGRNSKPLEGLIRLHDGLVRRLLRQGNIRPCDIDDVAGLVWHKVWMISRKSIDEVGAWNPARARGAADPVAPLIATIASTQAVEFHRRRQVENRRRAGLADLVERHGAGWRDEAAGAGASETGMRKSRREPGCSRRLAAAGKEMVLAEMARLPGKERRVLELHCEGLTNRAIAEMEGCSFGEVSRRLTKARLKIRRQVEKAAG